MNSELLTLVKSFFKGPGRFRRDFELFNRTRMQRFVRIFNTNKWGDPDSRSGTGSNIAQTETLRVALPPLLERLGTETLLDIPCGDFFWMKELSLVGIDYIGADIVPELIAMNQEKYSQAGRRFQACDLVTEPLPDADTIFCRDCLVHLSYKDIRHAIANIKASGATWLITTSFKERNKNRDIMTGKWRPLDMNATPFNWPEPKEWIHENNTEKDGRFGDKHLGIWKIADLP